MKPRTDGRCESLAEFQTKMDRKEAHVGIIGLGYVGLPLSLLFSQTGVRVTGFDIDRRKTAMLSEGTSYIHRISSSEIREAHRQGFSATTDFSEISGLDAILICVPTPINPDHSPDLSYVEKTIEEVAPFLRNGHLVVLESTTYPGTTEEVIVKAIEAAGNKVLREELQDQVTYTLDGILVAYSPEREDPGNVTVPRWEVPKVVGGINEAATRAACSLYEIVFRKTVAMSSPAAAEMTKLLENIYRSVNIALVNQIKMTCIGMGIDVWEVIDAASTKPFGFQAFYPGPGVGGHCIPVDPFYFSWKAEQYGLVTPFIELAGRTNEEMPVFVVNTIKEALLQRGKDLHDSRVFILGVAYKRDVDDIRESPSVMVINLLMNSCKEISYNDPYIPRLGAGRKYDLQINSSPLDELCNHDCVVIMTDHSCYDYRFVVDNVPLVVDTRNATRNLLGNNIVRC